MREIYSYDLREGEGERSVIGNDTMGMHFTIQGGEGGGREECVMEEREQ